MKLEERPKSKYVLYDDENDRVLIITSYKQIAKKMMIDYEKNSNSDSSEI
jgi:hypothetical protein